MSDRIINYIQKEIANDPLENIDINEDLLGNGIIDSIGMIKLISFLQEEFQVEVPSEDMIVENFMTVQHISDYISKRKEQ